MTSTRHRPSLSREIVSFYLIEISHDVTCIWGAPTWMHRIRQVREMRYIGSWWNTNCHVNHKVTTTTRSTSSCGHIDVSNAHTHSYVLTAFQNGRISATLHLSKGFQLGCYSIVRNREGTVSVSRTLLNYTFNAHNFIQSRQQRNAGALLLLLFLDLSPVANCRMPKYSSNWSVPDRSCYQNTLWCV